MAGELRSFRQGAAARKSQAFLAKVDCNLPGKLAGYVRHLNDRHTSVIGRPTSGAALRRASP